MPAEPLNFQSCSFGMPFITDVHAVRLVVFSIGSITTGKVVAGSVSRSW